MTASGTFGYGEEYAPLVNLHRLGALIVKGISLRPKPGNPPPRVLETPCGMLNAIGLQNVGIETFLAEKLPPLLATYQGTPVIANILGDTVEEYGQLASRLEDSGIAALEINISCPNVKHGGVVFGTEPFMARQVTAMVRARTSLPIITKLSPNVTDIAAMARAAEEGGADAVSLINTLMGMAIDVDARRPKLANKIGGLSGPAIRPIAVRMVWQVAQAVSIPIIGIGGITSGNDALEFLLAGATAVQVGTANFVNPAATMEVLDGIAGYLRNHKIAAVREIIGAALD